MRLCHPDFLSKYFKFKTLQQRLIFIVVTETSIILLLLSLVSFYTIHSIEKNKLKTSIASSLQQLSDKMTQCYANMGQVIQLMSPEGTIGSLLDNYFDVNSNFNRYRVGQQISDNLIKITFVNTDITCRTYFDPQTQKNYFYNFKTYDGFSPEKLNVLMKNGNMEYNSLHQSSSLGLGMWQVLSISRRVYLNNGKELVIYIEAKLDDEKTIDALSKVQKLHYALLQVDSKKRIQYSSTKDFSAGDSFKMENVQRVGESYFGEVGKYVGCKVTTNSGYTNVLLLPASEYNKELYAWVRNIIVILLLAGILFGFSFIFLSRLIYTPLAIFSKEMKKVGKGDLHTVSVHTGVIEYDTLFMQFNTMKKQIQKLLLNVENMAREKHKLEIEKIYYQINPHFLMNTLHSIHWLAKMHGQTEIEIFTAELNYILAYSLDKIDRQTTINTELKMLQSYLKLQKMRYDFKVELKVEDGDYLETPTARMILQPIAENAIHHGLGEEGCLSISVSHSDLNNAIIITMEDNGKGLTNDELHSIKQTMQRNSTEGNKVGGIGLRYVYGMLESFYGDRAIINIESELTQGTKVTLLLPIDSTEPVILTQSESK